MIIYAFMLRCFFPQEACGATLCIWIPGNPGHRGAMLFFYFKQTCCALIKVNT